MFRVVSSLREAPNALGARGIPRAFSMGFAPRKTFVRRRLFPILQKLKFVQIGAGNRICWIDSKRRSKFADGIHISARIHIEPSQHEMSPATRGLKRETVAEG